MNALYGMHADALYLRSYAETFEWIKDEDKTQAQMNAFKYPDFKLVASLNIGTTVTGSSTSRADYMSKPSHKDQRR